MSTWIPILAAAIGAFVALTGYLLNRQADRRQERAKFYAEAIRSVKVLEELPYRIIKRRDSSPETRERLGKDTNDAYIDTSFFLAWLQIDSEVVGSAYELLVRRTGRALDGQLRHAWSQSPIADDKDSVVDEIYFYESERELSLCIRVMRRQLALTPIFWNRRSRKEINECDRTFDDIPTAWADPLGGGERKPPIEKMKHLAPENRGGQERDLETN